MYLFCLGGFPGGSDSKDSACNAGRDPGSIPELGTSPGEGTGYPLQYSCLENPMDRGAWWATVHGVAELDTTQRLHFLSFLTFLALQHGLAILVPWPGTKLMPHAVEVRSYNHWITREAPTSIFFQRICHFCRKESVRLGWIQKPKVVWPNSAFPPRQFSSVQLLSHVRLFATPWTTACQASLSITNSLSPPKPMSIELVMPSTHFILCCPLLYLPSIFPSIRVFSNESALHIRWPKYWSFSFSISPSNEYSGLISFRMDWLDLLSVQGTLKSLLQHHSSKSSILRCSPFCIVQLSHPYMTWQDRPLLAM